VIALKLKAQIPELALSYLKEHNKLKRCVFNLMLKRGITHVQAVKVIESEYNYDRELVDNFLLRDCIGIQADGMVKSRKALGLKSTIFGSRKLWKKQGDLEEWRCQRDTSAITYTGRKISNGNSKFALDADSLQVVFKPKRGVRIVIPIRCTKKRQRQLQTVQRLAEEKLIPFSVSMNGTHLSVIVDETVFQQQTAREFTPGRVAAYDSNPNVLGLVVRDMQEGGRVLYRECVDLYGLKKSHNSDKIRYELSNIAKRWAKRLRHLKVEVVGYEKLTMTGDAGKGKAFNRAVSNDWKREHMHRALRKWLTIENVAHQEVAAQYSSTIGCLQYPDETDSIAAAMELARRTHVFYYRFILKHKDFTDVDVVYPPFERETLSERWNSKIAFPSHKLGWVSLHRCIKDMKPNPLRLLFSNYDFSQWFCSRPGGGKSLVRVLTFKAGKACDV